MNGKNEVILKKFSGYSTSEVYLMQSDKTFVRKVGNVTRNLERLGALSALGIPTPKIHWIDNANNSYDMEYIHGLDMKTYLLNNHTTKLIDFILDVLSKLSKVPDYQKGLPYNYISVMAKKLEYIEKDWVYYKPLLPFSPNQLLRHLNDRVDFYSTEYCGDLTLDNIIWEPEEDRFVLIDPATIEYDSYIFDIAKLKQDTQCMWFIRNHPEYHLASKLHRIDETLNNKHYTQNHLVILMLLRILPYARKINESDEKFLLERIKELWIY